jgi:hypothetical protein
MVKRTVDFKYLKSCVPPKSTVDRRESISNSGES